MTDSIAAPAVPDAEAYQWPITIGVAVPIPEPFLAELGAYRERFGDPLAHAIVAHITLVPPTEVADAAAWAGVLAHLARVAATAGSPFPVTLAGAQTFRPVSPVVFVPLAQGEPRVRALEAASRQGPLATPLFFPFHPHVTVVHDVSAEWLDQAQAALADYRAVFEVSSIALFVRGAEGIWRQRAEFPFGG